MAYAPPAWLPNEENEKGMILVLDDFSRANPTILQAVMELVDRGMYMTWSLPKNTTILLTANPDNGEYVVNSVDSAFASRMVKFNVDFNIEDWASWAEFAGIDGRAINFALSYSTELFENQDRKLFGLNARSFTTFCNCISGMKEWEQSLETILSIANGCFNDPKGYVGGLFTNYISMKLDKLPQPRELLETEWEKMHKIILDLVWKHRDESGSEQYDACVASILATRLCNYILKCFATKNGIKESAVTDRILNIVEANEKKRIFSEDLIFNMCKTLITKYPARTKGLLINAKIRNALL